MRKYSAHPAYKPVTVVPEFAQRETHVVMDYWTKDVLWSADTFEEADSFGKVFADTLETDVLVLTTRLSVRRVKV